MEFCKDLEPRDEDVSLARELVGRIKPYLHGAVPSKPQQVSLVFAHRNVLLPDEPESGIIIGDEQGCGKTLMALWILLLHWLNVDPTFAQRKGVYSRPAGLKPTIIVASASTIATWTQEINLLKVPTWFFGIVESGRSVKHNDDRRRILQRSAVIITTSSALVSDAFPTGTSPRESDTSLVSLFGKCDVVVVDEADKVAAETVRRELKYLPPRDTKYKKELIALLELMAGCSRRIMLTGTPWVANNPRGKFSCLIMMCNAFVFLRRCLPFRMSDEYEYYWLLCNTDDEVLRAFMKHKVLRRRLNDVRRISNMETIQTNDHVFTIPLSSDEHARMTEMEASVSETIKRTIASTSAAAEISAVLLAQVTYLRQLCEINVELGFQLMQKAAVAAAEERARTLPAGVSISQWLQREEARVQAAKDKAIARYFPDVSAKVSLSNKEQAILDMIGNVKKAGRHGKMVVFTQFVVTNQRIIDIVQRHHKDVKTFHLKSSLKPQERGLLIADFNRHDGPAVMVLNVKVGARGLNLQAARYVIILSIDFNPATKEQSEARVKRFSSRYKSVHLCTFLMHSTIQPWVLSRIVADKVNQSEQLESRDPSRVARMRSTFANDAKDIEKDPAKVARQFSVDVLEFTKLREETGGVDDDFDLQSELQAALQEAIAEAAPEELEVALDEADAEQDEVVAEQEEVVAAEETASVASNEAEEVVDLLDSEESLSMGADNDEPQQSSNKRPRCSSADSDLLPAIELPHLSHRNTEDSVRAQIASEEREIKEFLGKMSVLWAMERNKAAPDNKDWPVWDVVLRS